MTKTIDNLGDLTPDPRNARAHNPRNVGMIEAALSEVGAARSIVIDEDGVVLAGNATIEAAAQAGIERVHVVDADGETIIAVRRSGLTPEQKTKLALFDNRAAELAEWDASVLASLAEETDLSGLFRDEELAELLAGVDQPDIGGGGDEFDPQPQEGLTRTQAGDLWQIGPHRLIVGDCTDPAVVERLMGGERADMMFVDPPYGVDYTGGHFHSGDVNIKRERERLSGDDNTEIYSEFLPIVLPWVDGPCYMWFAGSRARDVYNAVYDNGCEIHALIIWHKVNATYAAMNAQYKQRHEPCLYFKPKGSTLRWAGPSDECTVWEVRRDSVNEFHPTQKPIELPVRAMGNHKAKTVLDVFMGSGTTLIAAHQTGRRCYGCEIEPRYADVILRRAESAGLSCTRVEE